MSDDATEWPNTAVSCNHQSINKVVGLTYMGADEWIVSVIKAVYEDASTKVRMNGRDSERE